MRVTFIPAAADLLLNEQQQATVDYLARVGERDHAHSLIVEAPNYAENDLWRVDLIGGAAVEFESTTWSMGADGELTIR